MEVQDFVNNIQKISPSQFEKHFCRKSDIVEFLHGIGRPPITNPVSAMPAVLGMDLSSENSSSGNLNGISPSDSKSWATDVRQIYAKDYELLTHASQ